MQTIDFTGATLQTIDFTGATLQTIDFTSMAAPSSPIRANIRGDAWALMMLQAPQRVRPQARNPPVFPIVLFQAGEDEEVIDNAAMADANMFEGGIQEGIEDEIQEGIHEGIEEGIQEGIENLNIDGIEHPINQDEFSDDAEMN